jgi:hypothetical protein
MLVTGCALSPRCRTWTADWPERLITAPHGGHPQSPQDALQRRRGVYATAIIVLGIVALVTVAVLRADPKDCPETIRAVADLIRAFAEVVRGL